MRRAWVALVGAFIVVGCSSAVPSIDDGGDMSDGANPDDSGNPMDDGSMGTDTGSGMDSGMPPMDSGMGLDTGVNDPYAAARAACLMEINKLRATEGHKPYNWWAGQEMCVDKQATNDEQNK